MGLCRAAWGYVGLRWNERQGWDSNQDLTLTLPLALPLPLALTLTLTLIHEAGLGFKYSKITLSWKITAK